MKEVVEMGKVSSRGQIAIPVDIRNEMGLEEGSKVLFLLEDDVLLIKKVTSQTWEQITAPLREQKKKINQENVSDLIHRMRKRRMLPPSTAACCRQPTVGKPGCLSAPSLPRTPRYFRSPFRRPTRRYCFSGAIALACYAAKTGAKPGRSSARA